MGVGTNYQESGNKANQAAGLCVWGGGLGETDHKRKKPTVVFSEKKNFVHSSFRYPSHFQDALFFYFPKDFPSSHYHS
jgi:hypothetical protein